MAKELAKQYDPKGTEDRIYQEWCDKGYFHTQIDRSKKPFTIVMPPPNVTGQLHMGHAMDETWQDILTRYKRMQGYAALWVPGTDHASIATEAKVVAAMREEGLTKEMLGRDGFLERAWAWKNTYGSRIVSQLKKLSRYTFFIPLTDIQIMFLILSVTKAMERMITSKPLVLWLLSQLRVREAERWLPACLSCTMSRNVVFVPVMRSLRHSRSGISR